MSLVTLSEYGSSRKLQNFWILIPEPSVEDYGVVTIQLSHPACEPKKPRTLAIRKKRVLKGIEKKSGAANRGSVWRNVCKHRQAVVKRSV